MCLYVDRNTAKIRRSIKRRVCWKVVRRDSSVYYSPFHGVRYDVGDTVRIGIFEPIVIQPNVGIGIASGKVGYGLHTYVNKADAVRVCKRMNNEMKPIYGYSHFEVLECCIPFFARFIEGVGGDSLANYVSSRLKVIKVI